MNQPNRADAIVPDGVDAIRVDKFIAEELEIFSRSQMVARNIEIYVNGRVVKASHRVHSGDSVLLLYDDLPEQTVSSEPIDLAILYEDDHVVVLDKPTGMVVHPAAGNWSGTVVQGLLHHVRELESRFGTESVRPGIVHRLDKDTSGVLIAAKDPETLRALASQFSSQRVQKTYLAVVKGRIRSPRVIVTGRIERDPSQRKRFRHSETHGKEAESEIRLLRQYREYAFVAITPRTGRTHQIRVHLQHLGCPVVGDAIYSRRDNRFPETPLMLHAYKLSITLSNDADQTHFCAPLPQRFKKVLADLGDSPNPGAFPIPSDAP